MRWTGFREKAEVRKGTLGARWETLMQHYATPQTEQIRDIAAILGKQNPSSPPASRHPIPQAPLHPKPQPPSSLPPQKRPPPPQGNCNAPVPTICGPSKTAKVTAPKSPKYCAKYSPMAISALPTTPHVCWWLLASKNVSSSPSACSE